MHVQVYVPAMWTPASRLPLGNLCREKKRKWRGVKRMLELFYCWKSSSLMQTIASLLMNSFLLSALSLHPSSLPSSLPSFLVRNEYCYTPLTFPSLLHLFFKHTPFLFLQYHFEYKRNNAMQMNVQCAPDAMQCVIYVFATGRVDGHHWDMSKVRALRCKYVVELGSR